jgi:hypothetical protein
MKRLNFEQAPIFYVFADILGKLDFVAANICVYFQ